MISSAVAKSPAKPNVDIGFPGHQYKAVVNSLREIDFKNFSLWTGYSTVKLRHGKYHLGPAQRDTGSGREDGAIARVWYFDRQDGQPERALIHFWIVAAEGSSSDTGFLQVLELRNGHPTVIQDFEYDEQALPWTGASFNPHTGVLRITARSDDGSAHCCPSYVDVISFDWSGDRFKLRRWKRVKVTNKLRGEPL